MHSVADVPADVLADVAGSLSPWRCPPASLSTYDRSSSGPYRAKSAENMYGTTTNSQQACLKVHTSCCEPDALPGRPLRGLMTLIKAANWCCQEIIRSDMHPAL